MRACAAIGVVITHVAFQTGHTTWSSGRLLGRFDLAVAVFFALSGFLLWRGHAAAARGLRHVAADGPLPALQDRPHHARLPGGGRGDPHAVPRRQRRPDGVAGQPDADPDLRAADVDVRADADVEPVGRGQLLSGAAGAGAAGAAAAGAGEDPGHPGRRAGELRLGTDPDLSVPVRRQSADVAACLLLVVRRGHADRRTDGDARGVGAPAGPAPGADGRSSRWPPTCWPRRRWPAPRAWRRVGSASS